MEGAASSDAGRTYRPRHRVHLGPPLARPRWGLAAASYGLALLVGVAYGYALRAAGDWHIGAPWERAMLFALHVDQPAWLDLFWYLVPWTGTNVTLLPAVGVLAAWLVYQQRRDLAIWVGAVELGVLTLNWLTKHSIQRDRPDLFERVGWFGWASYPSGHAMASLAVLLTVGLLVHRATGRWWGVLTALVLFVLVCYSRMYHGVHWPTDVIGGVLVGTVWVTGAWFAFVGVPQAAAAEARG